MRHGLPSRRDALAGGFAALACAAQPFASRPAGAQDLPKLRVAYQPYEYSAQVFYAQEMGFFSKAGLSVELQEIAYGAAVATAVVSNAVDIGVATITTLAIAHSKGIPFTIVAPGAEFNVSRPPTGFLMVGNQTSIHSGKDMNGKIVGTPGLATLGEYGVRTWVDANGGDSTTLKFQELPFSQMPAAFATGRIDAAFIGEPFLTDARKVARVLSREMDTIAKEFVITSWFTTVSWANAHPDLVAKFQSAIGESSAWALKNPEKCVQIIAKTFKQDPATIPQSGLATFPQHITPALIDAEIAITAKYGKFAPFPGQDLIYNTRS